MDTGTCPEKALNIPGDFQFVININGERVTRVINNKISEDIQVPDFFEGDNGGRKVNLYVC
jgi:hypothetical protein